MIFVTFPRHEISSLSWPFSGVVQVGQVARFGIFLKSASRLVPDGWVGLKSFGYRCHFRAFQLELDTLDTQNIGNGPVVEELQPLEVGRIPGISGKSQLSSVSAGMGNSWQWFVFIQFWDPQKVFAQFFIFFITRLNTSYGLYIWFGRTIEHFQRAEIVIFYVFDGKIIFGWYFEPTRLPPRCQNRCTLVK